MIHNKERLLGKEFQLKLRTNRETNKEHLTGILKTCYKKANSIESFYDLLKECKAPTYERNGIITGVIFNKIKFRFSRLGFTEDSFLYLDRSAYRSKELNKFKLQKEINIQINR